MRISIRGGRLIDPANNIDRETDLHIADGRVVGVGAAPDGFTPDWVSEAGGRVVCPGLIDLCARLREPGAEDTATIASETRAAAAGGITTVVCPPDTDPVIDEPAVVELIHRRARAAGHARVLPLGALTRGLAGEHLSEMAALKEAGCVAVSDGGRSIGNTLVLRRALEYAASHDLTVLLTPADAWLSGAGRVNDGAVATRLGLTGIPVAAETAVLARDLALIEELGVRAHFGRLSSARAVEMVAQAQAAGLAVTADVAAPYLHLTELDVGRFDSLCHVLPPLRGLRDRDALRHGVSRGVLAAICSDHQPHPADAKLNPFADTAPGIAGLETLLSLALRYGSEAQLPLSTTLERLTVGPARILGLDAGHLGLGAVADVCVFDPNAHWVADHGSLRSRGRNTPFCGWELPGRATLTLLAGRCVHGDGPAR